MKPFYKKSISFWFILLVIAFVNAIIRETTYKPFLTPLIGGWAHQISSLTGILFFFAAIYVFIKHMKETYSRSDLMRVGLLWMIMTIVFESGMNIFVRRLSFGQVIQTYYFWKGDLWIFVLLSLVISPLIIQKMLQKRNH